MGLRFVRRAVVVAVAAGLAACNNPFSSDDTRIRLRNASSFELTDVTFQPGGPKLEFSQLAAGEVTPYTKVKGAYRYGYLDVLVGGDHRRIQPTDYVGEDTIGGGRYTYVITVEPTTRNPAVQLVRD